ncbi:hypothetical protein PR202_ga01667 [Eleusine coracana subsp. coracana]|uniref:Uncharacterized protein n=1 Tax=Eleusine coracana subsp. coracana TaxID=191504 RepID=A0AAV5BHP5_ELECO|nr:hypothetical protein PR202_ga00980 [Eleusine coracana subsp. coracana]GJM85862.1 hypothetical protein PR202_ga01667 [Eleusine coracana subsp. coracana]
MDAVKKDSPALGSSLVSVFMHADAVDVALMLLGLVGAMGDGMSLPVTLLFFIRITNDLGRGPDVVPDFSSRINANAMSLVFLACASSVMAFLEGYCWARTAERQASRMRARYLRAVLRQDMEYFDLLREGFTSEVVTSVSSDSLVVHDALGEKLPNFLMNATTFVGSYVVGFAVLWRLTLVALPSVLLLVIPGLVYGRILNGIARRVREQYARPGGIAEQAVSSARTVYAFVAERSTLERFSAALEESARLGVRQGLAKGVAVGSNGVTLAIWAFNIWYGSRLVMYHGYPGGTVFAVSSAIVNGGLALGSALSNVKYFSEAGAAAERIAEVIRRVPKIDSTSDAGEELANVAGEVEFKNVQFSYPSRPESPIFVNFSLRVPAGRKVALVGSSGSGKSTVITLLQRFYDPSAGLVMLDGVDIRRLRLKWLRAQMGLVSQEPALFATSIHENILLGKEDATVEEVIAAAKAANAHDFISQLPRGYDTQILLLDEATSALDTQSERIVKEALDLTSIDQTTIVVAHRLSTIRNVDMIAVMQYGEVKELGSHDELITNEDGLYASLTRLQQMKDPREAYEVNENDSKSSTMGQSSNHNMSRKLSSFSRSSPTRLVRDIRDNNNNENPKLHVPSFRRLLMLNAPEWKQAVMGIFSAVAFGAVQPVQAYGMGILSLLLNIGQHYSFGAMGEYLTKRIREKMLAKILTFEIGWFDHDGNSTGLGLGTSVGLMTCSWALDFWYGAKLMTENRITTKELMQTFMILITTGRVLADAGTTTRDLAKGGDAVASVFAVLDRVTEIEPDNPMGHKPDKLKGEVQIVGVDFSYPSRPNVIVFKELFLNIQAEKSTALVGQSGSGKSTIIGLIERFYEPLSGIVKIDGCNIKTYNLRALRRHIGLVSQDPTLFAGTIRENIIYGTESASEAEIESAARSANAHGFISNLKDGYDTWCGERGFQLSGGQKQRIAIARAILNKPAILLLDEATSALDSQSEKAVQEALDRVMMGRTSVVVAHRLSTIQNCDMIYVLDNGVVVEKGTHATLMSKGFSGTYFGLVTLQQGATRTEISHGNTTPCSEYAAL